MLAMLGIFGYIWYWGGFEKNDEGTPTHVEALEKILKESNFEADNKELPENLEAAHKMLVETILEKVESQKSSLNMETEVIV